MDSTEEPRCVVCHSHLHGTEARRWACSGCQQAAARQLGELPSLYRQLDEALIPGRGVPTVATRTGYGPRTPATLDVMDLTDGMRGGALARLVSCVRDWAESGADGGYPDWPPGEEARVRVLCQWLRFRLDWACGMHQGVGDSIRDIRDLHGRIQARVTGDPPERPVYLKCRCGSRVPWRVGQDWYRCDCGAIYNREDAAALPKATPARAAA